MLHYFDVPAIYTSSIDTKIPNIYFIKLRMVNIIFRIFYLFIYYNIFVIAVDQPIALLVYDSVSRTEPCKKELLKEVHYLT
jgi:hypothetical protein